MGLRPQVFGFVLSLAVIGYYWLSHRLVFLVTIPIAFLSGWVAIAPWVLIPVGRGVIARRGA